MGSLDVTLFISKNFLDFPVSPATLCTMNSATLSKFDVKPACEESAPDFVPSHNDLIDSLPEEILEESYRGPTVGETLWELMSKTHYS